MKYDSEFREFLIRRRGGEFVIKRVSSLMAASFYRPQRVPESRYEIRRVEEGGQVFCFIKNIANGRILRLTERGFDLWSLMDGKTSLRSMAAGLFMKYGAFDFGEMRGLIRKLQTAGLIRADIPPLIRIQQFFSRFSHPLFGALAKWTIYLASINLSITQTDVKMRQLYRNTRRLFFSKIFLWVSVIGCCCMSFVFIRTFTHGSYDLRYFLDQPWKWFVSYFFLF
ncbi:MAG: hypothetical protein Q8Q33_02620 [Chlamydiota bacterium]|nr:hypothetical protein [Chlamydiota bacterium]